MYGVDRRHRRANPTSTHVFSILVVSFRSRPLPLTHPGTHRRCGTSVSKLSPDRTRPLTPFPNTNAKGASGGPHGQKRRRRGSDTRSEPVELCGSQKDLFPLTQSPAQVPDPRSHVSPPGKISDTVGFGSKIQASCVCFLQFPTIFGFVKFELSYFSSTRPKSRGHPFLRHL